MSFTVTTKRQKELPTSRSGDWIHLIFIPAIVCIIWPSLFYTIAGPTLEVRSQQIRAEYFKQQQADLVASLRDDIYDTGEKLVAAPSVGRGL